MTAALASPSHALDPDKLASTIRPIIFGKLCLLERVSVGGMAEVYKARPFHAPNFDRLLAVKRILPNLAEDQEFIQMFLDEAKICVRLDHPNIVQMYELGKRGHSHYLVMEYIAGQDLLTIQNWYRRRRTAMPPEQAGYIALMVARALGHAHGQKDDDGTPLGIVHRDVSPQNILASYRGEVKLIDFGIAKVVNRRTAETQAGVLKGKFSYMSPEHVMGMPIDHRADLFSLGTVLHELLTGRRLFAGESDFHTLERVREARVEAPSSANERVPGQLDNIVLRLLARDPDKRYPHADALAADLESWLATVEPTYTQQRLSDWMCRAFADELQGERDRREVYRRFVAPEDVVAHNDRMVDELRRALGAPVEDLGEPHAEEGEITQVAELVDEAAPDVVGNELERGSEDEVLAEQRADALPRLLIAGEGPGAALDLPEPTEAEEPPAELFEPHARQRPRTLRLPMALLLLAGLAVAGWSVFLQKPDAALEPGTVMLEVTPPAPLEIFLDGRLVERRAPTVLRGVAAGPHQIEVRHPLHETHRALVEVEPGRALHHRVALTPLAAAEATLVVEVVPADAEVWLDGELATDAGSDVRVRARQPLHLAVRREGYYVHEVTLELGADETRREVVRLRPVVGTLVLRSDPPGSVWVDGLPRGSTARDLVLSDLQPATPYALRIEPDVAGFRAWETTVLLDGALELSLFPSLRRLGDGQPPAEPGFGRLTVDSGARWYRVLVDGWDTGRTTPVTAAQPLALRPGLRQVTLVRGEEAHEALVAIDPGQTATLGCAELAAACAAGGTAARPSP